MLHRAVPQKLTDVTKVLTASIIRSIVKRRNGKITENSSFL
jgi:hypothetical protein